MIRFLLSCSAPGRAGRGAAARQNAIQPELVVEVARRPGRRGGAGDPDAHQARLARLLAQPRRRRPADERRMEPAAGLVGRAAALSGAGQMLVAGIVNYVYERDYAVLLRLKAPAGITGLAH